MDTEPIADAVEVTPAMIEAGYDAYASHFLDLMRGEAEVPRRMVREVFLEMYRLRR